MISTVTYNGDGATRVFPVAFEIKGEDYVVVFLNNVAVSDRTKYDIINNSIVFRVGDEPTTGTNNIEIVVASSPTEIADLNAPPSTVQVVVDNITGLQRIVDTILPVLPEILQADDNATIATTKASEASSSASSASNSATTATTKASEANASATSASNSATSASNSATTATTKANEASASASSALTSANNASTSETMAYKWSSNPVDTIVATDKYSAFHWATKAQEWANSVDASNIVHKTGDETINGVKTFTSFSVTPSSAPTTNYQVANKKYVDDNNGISLATANSYDFGVNQTWQNVTASRASGVTYTNSTGKAICVKIIATSGGTANSITFSVNGINFNQITYGIGNAPEFNIIIPNSATYSATYSTAITWFELR